MPTKINLTLPRTWNVCTTEQLELIANIIREQIDRQDRYHPFSMQNVKIAIFFALSGIEIVEGPNPRVPVEEQYYTCRLQSHRSRWFSPGLHPRFRSVRFGQGSDTFSLYLWQIDYWVNGSPLDKNGRPIRRPSDKGKGKPRTGAVLDWIDNDQYLTKFPYPTIKRRRPSGFFSFLSSLFTPKVSFQGPFRDLDGFCWSQYRLATEAMQNYIQISNSLAKMKQMGTFSAEQMRQQAHSVDTARALFLSAIFNRKVQHVDTSTGLVRKDFHYESNQITENLDYFRNFPDTQWQVILFWWTGIMHTLSKRYPHVFKVQKTPSHKGEGWGGALEIYTATIATMQKYVGINERDCNNQSYSIVLEQLERISKENEELERIRKKK